MWQRRRPVRPAAVSQKRDDQVRIRNRRYKVKRYLAQSRNIYVRQNGRVNTRMIVRRQTIYPSARRKPEH